MAMCQSQQDSSKRTRGSTSSPFNCWGVWPICISGSANGLREIAGMALEILERDNWKVYNAG
jgi:hypothetical protein